MIRRAIAPTLGVAAFALVAGVFHHAGPVERARALFSRTAVPATALGSKKIRAGLYRSGALHPVAPVDLLAKEPADSGGRCPPPLVAAGPAPGEAPSLQLLPAAWRVRRDVPVVSLYLEPCRLQRLLDHPRGRGPEWEEPGWLSFQDDGAIRYSAAVGVRLHGDRTRLGRGPKSFRVYFRPSGGAAPFPGEWLTPELAGLELDQLILHNDVRPDVPDPTLEHRFLNPLSYDIARRAGLEVPATRPVVLVLNGDPAGAAYVLTERLGAEWAERRFGHADFDVLPGRSRLDPAEQALWDELRRRLLETPDEGFAAWAAANFDLDSVLAWYAVVQLCATDDQLQAALVRDRRDRVGDGRWFVVPWDMDLGFRKRRPHGPPAWRKNNFPFFHQLDPGRKEPLRILVHRLFRSAPGHARDLAQRIDDLVADPAWFEERLAFYGDFARRAGVDDLRFLAAYEHFLRHRPEEVRRQMAEQFREGLTASVPTTSRAPSGSAY